jgi:hypothetical protein
MPATWLDDPEQWWARGEHARLMAEQLADREAKRILLDIAEGYDRMAEIAAQQKAARENAPD